MYQPVKKALDTIGSRGTYQKLMILLMFFIAAEVNYFIMGPTFIFMNPLFRCSFTDELVDESIACDRLHECEICKQTLIKKVLLALWPRWDSTVNNRTVEI